MQKDQRDLLLAFNGVRDLLVGGYAIGRYTEPRATKDLDVFVEITDENAERLFSALVNFGAPLQGYTPKDFQDPYAGYQLGLPPSQIDIIFALSALTFQEAWEESLPGFAAEDIPVRYISFEHLIRNKTAAGRLQDLADVAALEAARKANGREES